MTTQINPLAGKPAPSSSLIDVAKLVVAYFEVRPDPAIPAQRVVFGTSGHRGSAFNASFNEWHVLAITQAICDYRRAHDVSGPLFLGIDTHALSEPACASGIRVSAADGWFAARPSGTEDIYKIYAESFRGLPQLEQILKEAQATVDAVIATP
jgi:phosphoglucomutase